MPYFKFPTRPQYASVSETDSETDGIEKGTAHWPRSRKSNIITWVLGLLVILQFIALYFVHLEASSIGSSSERIKSPMPELPIVLRSFHREDIYFNRSSPETDAAWAALAGPPKSPRGFVNVPDYDHYGLKKGAIAGDGVMYGVSMFHQLDCLATIRSMVWDLAFKRLDGEELIRVTPNDTASNFDGGLHHGFWHVQHCLDFIRQALQCHGDLTLEWPVEAGRKKLVVGWETQHQCRSYDAAWAYVDVHS